MCIMDSLKITCIFVLTCTQAFCVIKGDLRTALQINRDFKVDPYRFLCKLGCECPPDGQSDGFLDCSSRNITSLPEGLSFSRSVTSVAFQQNQIQNITDITFSKMLYVEQLDLSQNKLSTVTDRAFVSFKSLSYLSLTYNRITAIPESLLEGLYNLRVLEMGHNRLSGLPPRLFQHTQDLRELRLQYNKISVLQENTFQHLRNLEKLDLAGNGISSLHPNIFETSPRLIWLSLADNALEDVPNKIFRSTKSLSSLDLSANNFKAVQPGSFSALSNLSLLYLNNLKFLERIENGAFANMTKLKTLHCSYNGQLNYFHPGAFSSGLPSDDMSPPIDQIFLRQNALEHMPEPDELAVWSKVSHADFSENPWKCDCNLLWMLEANQEVFNAIRCETPWPLHGRTISSLSEEDLICSEPWDMSVAILIVTGLLVSIVCLAFFAVLVYSRSSIRTMLKADKQFDYSKVVPKTECLDLEWDPTADL